VKSLRIGKDISILQKDKANCTVVLDEPIYKDKLNTLPESEVYESLPKDATTMVERKIEKLLSKHKTVLPTDLNLKLTPCHSKPQHMYGLSKIHKPDIHLRPIVSSIGSLCYALAGLIHKILSPLASKSETFVKEFGPLPTVIKIYRLSKSRHPR
jgi:hypothetical protein